MKIQADVVGSETNGTLTKYYLRLRPGAKVSKIENCATEIALSLRAYSKPIIKVITEKGLVVVELLTKPAGIVLAKETMSLLAAHEADLPLNLGRSHDGQSLIADLSIMPHLLVAGATGSGKSVMLHSILTGLIESGRNVEFALIDPKKVELSYYKDIDRLRYDIVTDPDNALLMLDDLVDEMESRFRKLAKAAVNNINDFNDRQRPRKRMPWIVLVIDEFSDLMHTAKKAFQTKLCLLAQKSRSCGIHIILATQRPSVDVVTGLIKANFPARISCRVSSLPDSRVILGCSGAEKLLGKGDSLISSVGFDMVRFQGAYISTDSIQAICERHKRSAWSRFFSKLGGLK